MRRVNVFKYVILGILLIGVVLAAAATRKMKDIVPPVITCDQDILVLSVSDDKQALLRGLTAADAVDGDVTDSILVEKISAMDESGYRKVTYGAFDRSNNVAKYTRNICYSDYESPKFSLDRAMIFQNWNMAEALKAIHVRDCVDGDISNQVKLYSFEGDAASDNRELTVYLTNTSGETVKQTFPVEILNVTAEEYTMAPKIELKKYLIYMHKGDQTPDWRDYISAVKIVGEDRVVTKVDDSSDVQIYDKVNLAEIGSYEVTYTFADSNDRSGKTRLVVIVEE